MRWWRMDALVAEKVMGRALCDAWVHENLGSAGGPVSDGAGRLPPWRARRFVKMREGREDA